MRDSPNILASTEIKEAFALHDKRGNGTIANSSLGEVLRALGQNPTQKEVLDLQSQCPQDGQSRGVLEQGLATELTQRATRNLGQSTMTRSSES